MAVLRRRVYVVLRALIPLVAIVVGGAKIFGLPVEVEVFERMDLRPWFRVAFGISQVMAGLLVLLPTLEATGALLSAALLALAATRMLSHGLTAVACVPLVGILVLAVFLWASRCHRTTER